MTDIQFEGPTLHPERNCHSFALLDSPFFEHITTRDNLHLPLTTDCSGQFLQYFDAFLKRASTYFSKQLPVTTFIQRLQNTWTTGEFRKEELQFEGKAHVRWIPATVNFFKGQYEVEWVLIEIIPIREVKADLVLKGATPGLLNAALAVAATTEDAAASIPFKGAGAATPAAAAEKKGKLKMKIRKARMRVALAQLRAERLVEKYYIRYGNLEVEDSSDSELSYLSDVEAAEKNAIGGKI